MQTRAHRSGGPVKTRPTVLSFPRVTMPGRCVRGVGAVKCYADAETAEDFDALGELEDVLNSWSFAVGRF